MTTDDTLAFALAAAALVAAVLALVGTIRPQPWLALPGAGVIGAGIITSAVIEPDRSAIATVLAAIAFTSLGTIGGSPAVALVLRWATKGAVPLGDHGGILVRAPGQPSPVREVLRGGATIGYLERLALIGSVLAGQAAAIAIIVAIKGLGRFSELETSEARERFIIGTLTSLIWAGAAVAAAGVGW